MSNPKGMQPEEGKRLKELNVQIERLEAIEKDPDPRKAADAGRNRRKLMSERDALLGKRGEGFHKLT
jgi:hypothetical protein